MECTGILTGNAFSTTNKTLEQFRSNVDPSEMGPWGKLVLALPEEKGWSGEYSFSAHLLENGCYLLIHYPTSLQIIHPLTFKQGHDVSVRGVEDAVRAHLWKLHDDLQLRIAELQQDSNNLSEAAYQIVIDKARAAVVAVFPEACDATFIPCQATRHDLYAFAQNGIENVHSNPMYVVRVVDDEAVGGIARIEYTVFTWCQMGEKARLERFWAELAWTFAVLNFLSENEPRRRGHVFSTKVRSGVLRNLHGTDPYHVDKAVFPAYGKQDIVVEFGPDNLPVRAYVVSLPEQRVVGLVDKHMTPSI